jgi:diacylglycerol O-acyltransferase
VRTLSSEDAIFLYMETPDQHQHVVATFVLDPATAPDGFRADTLVDRFEAFVDSQPEFRQKLVKTPWSMTPPVLVEDRHFSFRNHIHHVAVPAPGTRRQLAMLVEDIASTALSHRRPLWECWFISGLADDRLAMVLKFHHCLADGVNGTAALMRLFDASPEGGEPCEMDPSEARRPPAWELTYRAMLSQWRYQPSYLDVASRTWRSLSKRRKLFSESETVSELVPNLFEEAPKLKFNAPITANRTAAMGSVSLADVKRVKAALNITVNDVVVAACTLALREYLIATDELPDGPLISCQPVSMALKGEERRKADQGNQVGVMSVQLPVHIADPAELVQTVCRATAAAKSVYEQCFENLMHQYIGVMPPRVADWALKQCFDRRFVERVPTTVNLVISNVPGPPMTLYLAGAKLDAGYGMGPIITGQGPNITFSSYADTLQFSILACREQIDDIWLLANGIEAGFAQLERLAFPTDEPPAARPRARAAARKRQPAVVEQNESMPV